MPIVLLASGWEMIKPRSWGEHRKEKLGCLQYSTLHGKSGLFSGKCILITSFCFQERFRVALPLPGSPTTSPGISLPKLSDLFKHRGILEIIRAGSMQFIFWVLTPHGNVSPSWFWVLKIQGRGFASFRLIYQMAENVNVRKNPDTKSVQLNHKVP